MEKRDLSRRQIKYLNMLFEYNIKIIYRSRLQNLKINAFIRIIDFKLIIKIITSNYFHIKSIEFR